jgi:hypothetical protein
MGGGWLSPRFDLRQLIFPACVEKPGCSSGAPSFSSSNWCRRRLESEIPAYGHRGSSWWEMNLSKPGKLSLTLQSWPQSLGHCALPNGK